MESIPKRLSENPKPYHANHETSHAIHDAFISARLAKAYSKMIISRLLLKWIVCYLVSASLLRAEVLETWIIAGQSNAEGYGITENPIAGLAPASTLSTIGRSDLNVTHSNIQMFQGANDSGLITASAGMTLPPKNAWHSMNAQEGLAYDWGAGRGSESGRRFGPELAFGYDVQAQIGAPIALIKYARGGASIASSATQNSSIWLDYDPSDGGRLNHYDKLITTIQTAVNNLPVGQVLNVRGVVWMQGEGDATASFAPNYQVNLTEFITTLRNDIGTIAAASGGKMTRSASAWSQLDVFLGTIQNSSANHQTVINAQNAVAAADANVFTVNASTGLSLMTVDDWNISGLHYDTAGQVLLGERFAAAALSRVQSDNEFPTYRNLAKYQKATGSTWGWSLRPDLFATDGIASNYHRWRSSSATGQTLDISYPRPVTIASAHLYFGVMASGTTSEIWGKFKLQYDNGGSWVDVPGASVTGNTASERNVIFTSAVTSNKFRLLNTDTDGNTVRSLREIAMFGPNVVNSVEQGYPIGTEVCVNLAHKRPATASSINGTNYAIKAVDGYVDDSSRWLCNAGVTGEWLEIDLLSTNTNGDAYQAVSSARLYSGDFATTSGALSDFTLQYWDTVNSVWAAIPGATITGNTQTVRTITFSSVVATNKVRLVNNTTGSAKIAELQFFPPSAASYPANQDVRMEAPPSAKAEDFSDATRHLRVSSASLKLGLIGGNAIFTNDAAGADALEWQLLLNQRDGSYRIRNVKNGQCLALANISTASNNLVIGETYASMPHQCWFLDYVNTTQFRLLNAYSGLALQALGGSTTPGTALAVVTPSLSTLQEWDTVWQAHFPKKGIAGTGLALPNFPGETYMSYYYGKFQHTSWSYSWGRDDSFPYMGADHTFNPMQWGNFFWGHSGTTPPLEGDRVYMQSQGKPFSFLGFNEPDHTDQANMTVAQVVALWPRLQSMDTTLVGPCPANPTNFWNADFYAAVNQLGYRVDYTPLHWYDSPNSNNFINKIKQLYALYGRPIWVTEFSSVRWSGTATWTHASNYNFMAEFLWRAESLPELARYSNFNWKREPLSPIDTIEAPRGNAFDENDNLTPYGELYASWDGVAQVLPQKAYHLHNHGYYQRMQSPASGNSFGFVTPDNSSTGTQWFLTAGATSNTFRIQTTRDGRPLVRTSGNPAAMGALNQVDVATEWTLVPVVSGADHDGWYYLNHPLTNQRLKNNGDGTCSMVATTDTSNAAKWRFVVPLVPEMQAVTDSATIIANQSVLIDVLANDGGRYRAPTIQSVGAPTSGTAVLENGKIRYTPPNGFTGNAQFTYTITDGTVTDSALVTIQVRFNQAPTVYAGQDQMVLLDEITALNPVAGAYFEWDAANDTAGNNMWTSTTVNTYNWTFDSGNQTPANVTDQRYARLSKAYVFPAAKDATSTTFDAYGSTQKATFEFVLDIDGNDGSIFETGGSGTGMQVDVVGGVLRGTVSATTPARASYTLTPTDMGRFIHVVFVADNVANVVQLYVDGVLKDTQPWTLGEDWSGGTDGSLGGMSYSAPTGGSTADFIGKLALFRFYNNKAFTVSDVTTNLNSLIGGRASTVALDGTVADADADALTTTWQVVSGPAAPSFTNASAVDTTAIFETAGTYVLRLSASDTIANVSDEMTITVLTATPYNIWTVGNFSQTFTSTSPAGNSDGDALTNLQEFAFGTDPTSPASGSLIYQAGGNVTTAGSPILQNFAAMGQPAEYHAVFPRRKDFSAAGLSYTVQFSADLSLWTSSATTPTLRTGAGSTGEMEAVSVPFPTSVSLQVGGSAPPKFFRIGVSSN